MTQTSSNNNQKGGNNNSSNNGNNGNNRRNDRNRNRNNGNNRGQNYGSNRRDFERREQEQAEAIKKYQVGQVVTGKIDKFIKAGPDHKHDSALVALKDGGTALLLYCEIPGYPRNILSDVFKAGEDVEVEITTIRATKNRMSVSLVPVMTRYFASKLERGMVVAATIIERVRDGYGYFMDLGGGLRALLHNDNLDTDFHNKLETFKDGEETEVVILSVEEEGRRIGVGRRQIYE